MFSKRNLATGLAVLLAGTSQAALAQSGDTMSMEQVIAIAIDSNPQIAQAQYNKEAIQFERKQAVGLYLPRLDVEASAGVRHLDNTTRRSLNLDDQELYPLEASAKADWTLVDFGRRGGELRRQAARVDGASLRVLERSEFVALQVARQYLDVLLQQRVVASSMDNVAFHRSLVGDLSEGVDQGSISVADQQQAEERLQAALVRQSEAEQSLQEAKNTLRSLSGLDIDQVVMPPSLAAQMPGSIDEAVGLSRTSNPRVLEAKADVDAAHALADSVRAEQLPTIGVDVTGRIGDDIDGFRGETRDVQGRVYLRWNLFDGGINKANYQEMVRRASESRYRLFELTRNAEQDVRNAWSRAETQKKVGEQLATQSRVSDDLLLSYRSQFNVGRRSLLDVLDAQNTRYSVQVRRETARFSELFARYQVLAATNRFLEAMNLEPGAGAGANEREKYDYGPSAPAELQYRTTP